MTNSYKIIDNNKHKEILLLLYTMNTRNDNEPRGRTYIREWKRKDYAKNGDKIKAKNKAEIRKMLIKKFKKIDDFEINPKRMLEPQIKMWHRKKGGMAPEDEEDNNEE